MGRAEYHAGGGAPSQEAGDSPRFAAIVPALNCAGTIASVVRGALEHVPVVLVIDDGSSDATGDLAREAGAQVLRHPQRTGKGLALHDGLAWAAENGFTHVLAMDGDGQHLSAEIPAMLECSRARPASLVLGERRRDDHDIKPVKLFGNRFANRWVEIASGRAFEDTQSGFRIYPVAATRALGAYASHYGFETEVLIRAVRTGMPVECVPVHVYYPPADVRISYYRPWVDTIRIIFIVLGLIFRLRR
jgi:glycosyltransferase involved in cell wall biosynthesis